MSEEIKYECSLCGRNLEGATPPPGCGTCHGNAQVQTRAYTLSDVHAGRAPADDRYGDEGRVGPKSSPYVVGAEVIGFDQ